VRLEADYGTQTREVNMTPHLEAAPPAYVPRDPSTTVLYYVVADHLETFLASLDADPDARRGGTGGQDGVAALELGVAAQACLCAGHDALPLVSAGGLQIIAAITQGCVIRKILRHLKLAVVLPSIAPARVRQEAFVWSSA
jgi:hypothetical protein